jgi:hypothetical protein
MDEMNKTVGESPVRGEWRTRLRVASGLAPLVVGLILAIPGVPGPGIPTIIVGLVMLSDHFAWARSALEWMRRKLHNAVRPSWRKWRQPSSSGSGPTPRPQGD